MSVQQMWIVNINRPWQAAKLIDCEVRIGPKQIVAYPVKRQYRSILQYGITVFGTEMIADAARRRRMKVFANPGGWYRRYQPEKYEESKRALEKEKP